jgi:hypothetical protein
VRRVTLALTATLLAVSLLICGCIQSTTISVPSASIEPSPSQNSSSTPIPGYSGYDPIISGWIFEKTYFTIDPEYRVYANIDVPPPAYGRMSGNWSKISNNKYNVQLSNNYIKVNDSYEYLRGTITYDESTDTISWHTEDGNVFLGLLDQYQYSRAHI